MLSRIKKDDNVVVISGKDKGKQGVVLKVSPKDGKALVKGIAIVTRHSKARKSGETSKIIKEETFVPLSKIMPVCKSCKKPCRIKIKFLENNNKVRVCHRCLEAF